MRRILVTNDDGVDAPGLMALADAMETLGEVEVVVPDRERSWVGKAITRFDPIALTQVERGGRTIHTVSGYPADAVQLGIHAVGERPDLVVSGINLGYNHGAGFLMSSGTVGAAVEAWIARVPAIAVSTGTMTDWKTWRALVHRSQAVESWTRLAETTAGLVRLVTEAGLGDHADIVSINLPFESTLDTPRRVTTIARVGYDRLFQPESDGVYVHAYAGGFTHIETVDGSDVDAANDGAVSITPVRLPAAAQVPESVRTAIETGRVTPQIPSPQPAGQRTGKRNLGG